MRTLALASRNFKEIIRDPLNLAFGLGFPLIILLLLTAIQSNIPVNLFEIKNLAPGIIVFGLSFISLFSATLIAKDRSTSFLTRLLASPLSATNFILGYTLPLLPMAIIQSLIVFCASIFLGLPVNINILIALIILIPTDILFIAIGLLAGSLLTDKQVGGVCGALLTNLTAWMSGTWFDLNLVGGVFKTIAMLLPFVYAVNTIRDIINNSYTNIFPQLWWVIGYALFFTIAAIIAFNGKMQSDDK